MQLIHKGALPLPLTPVCNKATQREFNGQVAQVVAVAIDQLQVAGGGVAPFRRDGIERRPLR